MGRMEVKKEKGNYRVSLFNSKERKSREKSHYWNIIDNDPKKLAQIFIDLWLEGFPIDQAYKVMQERLRRKDWLGL
jgi:hypothetical protein